MTLKLLKFALGSAFALLVLAYAPDAFAGSVTITGNVPGYTWNVTGPISGGSTGDYATAVPDGTYTISVGAPSNYFLSSINGNVPSGEYTKTGGAIVWNLTFASMDGAAYQAMAGSTTMVTGSTQSVSVTFTNTSGVTWTNALGFKLRPLIPPSIDWGLPNGVPLPASIPNGSNAVFNFNITAPVTPGSYTFRVAVMQEGISWMYVATPAVTVVVSAPVAAPTGTLEVRQDNTGGWTGANGTYPYNSTIEFRWTTTGASSCYLDPFQGINPAKWEITQNAEYGIGDGEEVGPLVPANQVTLLRLLCSNSSYTNHEVDRITITIGAGPSASVDLKVNGSDGPVNLSYGSSFTGSITMTNLTSCTVTINGSSPTTFTSSASGPLGPFYAPLTYAASCTGPYGSASDSVVVNMTGSITVTSNIPGLNWTLTGPATYNGTSYPTGVIPDAPFGSYTFTAPPQAGYDVTITPCNPQVLDDTAPTCP